MSNKALTTKTTYSLVDIRLDPVSFPRLINIPAAKARAALSKIIADAFLYRGQTADRENVRFIASALLEELLADDKYGLPFLTLEEIRRAVKTAVLTDENLFGVNVSSLYRVLLAYARGEGRQADATAAERLRATRSQDAPEMAALFNKYANQLINSHDNR